MDAVAGEPPSNPPSVVEGVARRAPHAGKRVKILKHSFVETMVSPPSHGDENMSDEDAFDWLDEAIEVESDSEPENMREGISMVKFSKAFREELIRPWQRALIIKFLGKRLTFPLLQQRLFHLWNINGKVELLDIGMGYYVVCFNVETEYKHMLLGGPWKLFDSYVIP